MPKHNGPYRKPVAERFWPRVAIGDGCWLWTGHTNARGYGKIADNNLRPTYAHRIAWELANGPIPEGMLVCHACDNTTCVRPDHLFIGTQKDNLQDMMQKGRATRYNSLKTHCARGHEFTAENTYLRKWRKGRRCRTCMRQDGARAHAKWRLTHPIVGQGKGPRGSRRARGTTT